MTYATEEQRAQARKESRRKYYLKTRKLKGVWPKRGKIERTKEYWLYHAAKARAKQAGIPFDLNVEDIVVPDICPALGIPLSKENIRNLPNSPSVDRFDNDLGYTKDNIRIISWRANKLKSDAKLEELEKIVNWTKNSA
jgi:hypothetical protein